MHSKGRAYTSLFGASLHPESATLAILVLLLFLIFVLLFMFLTAQPAQAQTLNVLYNFSLGEGPSFPWAGLTRDSAGNFYGTSLHGGGQGNSPCSYGCGTVFKLSKHGASWTLNVIHVFDGDDGAYPSARVVFGPDGRLYGTTDQYGGPGNAGTVFSLQPPVGPCKTAMCPWTETVLYRFTCGSDGCSPEYGDLVFDQAGNIYGTTIDGGVNCYEDYPYGCGVVYELTPSNGGWIESILHRFTGGSDGIWPYAGVILDQAGNLYGTTYFGGTTYGGVVYELTPSGSGWTEHTLYTFHAETDGASPYGGLIFDAWGNLFGTTYNGGGNQAHGTVFELSPGYGGWSLNVLHVFGGYGGPQASLTMDEAGNLYGTAQYGNYSGVVFKLHSGGWNYQPLYDFTGGDGGGRLQGNVVVDGDGKIYGTSFQGGAYGYGVVWEITP